MTKIVEAIYEKGVLRPIGAPELRERQHVEIVVREPNGSDWPAAARNESERQAALRILLDEVDRMNLRLHMRSSSRDRLPERHGESMS